MFPDLARLGPWTLGTHDVFVVVGALVGALVFLWEARRRGEWEPRHAAVAAGALLGGALAAKLGSGWRYLLTVDDPSLLGLLAHGGKTVLGGLAGAYGGAVVAKRLMGVTASTGDLFAPAVPAAMAIGRIGCLLTEQLGTATSLPWGVSLSPTLAARVPNCPQCLVGPVHPSFVYEIAFHLVTLVAVVALRDRIPLRGELFRWWLLAYGLFRFAVEFVRGNPTFWWGLTGSQWFLLVTLPLLGLVIVRHARSGLYRAPTAPPRTPSSPLQGVPG